MKKALLFAIPLSMMIAFGACKKETKEPGTDNTSGGGAGAEMSITQQQVPILFKITGETCYYCGDWGWAAWKDLAKKYTGGKGFTWSNYGVGFSNSFFRNQEMTPTMEPIEQMFEEGGGKPNFATNGKDYSTSAANAGTAADASIAETAKVSANMEATVDGTTVTVKAAAKFFEDMAGEYYMGVYLVEDKVSGPQSGPIGSSGNVDHYMVMRGSLTDGNAWGVSIKSDAKSGDYVEKTYTATIKSGYNKDNFKYGVIIWKKDGAKYSYVNAFTNQ